MLAAAVFIGLVAAGSAVPPASEELAGVPFIRSYNHREYAAHPQNWAAAQDARGVMYFGNTDGVLEFDGVAWRSVPVANGSIVRSLAVDREGTVYVGAVGELGRLRSGRFGDPAYESLIGELPVEERNFADVWRTFAIEDSIFFWHKTRLLRWQGGRFKSWKLASRMVPGVVRGKLYSNREDLGLVVLEGDEFIPVAGAEDLEPVVVSLMLPADEGAIFIASRDGHLFRLSAPEDGRRELEPLESEAEAYLAAHKVYTGVGLPDGTYLLATMSGGAVVVGRRGEVLARFDQPGGLPDNSVWGAFVDREGGLWLTLNRGLSRLEISSPIQVFAEPAGIEGTVEALVRHQGTLYAGTGTGLFRLAGRRFERIPGVAGPCWSLLSFDSPGTGRLLVGANPGVYEIRGARARLIRSSRNAFQLYQSSHDPSVVLVGEAGGLAVLRFEKGAWIDDGLLAGVDDEIRSIAEDGEGNLWLGTHFKGVIRVSQERGETFLGAGADRFGLEEGLPDLKNVKLLLFKGRLLAATPSGLWHFDPAEERFAPDPMLGPPLEEGGFGILRLTPDRQGNLWLCRMQQALPAVARRRPDGSFTVDDVAFRRLPRGAWYAFLPEPGGAVWFGGTEGLFRYDATVEDRTDTGFRTLIRSVSKSDGTLLDAQAAEVRLPYEHNSLVFEFAATSFGNEDLIGYRHLLEGFEKGWSAWSPDTKKEYTNLSEGRYRFRVQAKNGRDTLGTESSHVFYISPPWYRSTRFRIAVSGATALLGWFFLAGLVRRTRRLQRELSERERAGEREQLIARLAEQNDELERFTYTVSHDLKSPLVTIRGFVGLIRRDIASGKIERLDSNAEHIDAAARKMSRLLDELLALSRVGRQVNPPEAVPFGEVVAEAEELLEGEIRERGLEISVDRELPVVRGDRARLVEVVQNLLQNAAKYAGDEPAPQVRIGTRRRGDETIFYVRDNGIGIEPRYQERIFGLFERLDVGREGSGVGLALVKRIVEVHGGRVWVESEGAGKGSTFCFTLGKAEPPS